MTREGVDNTLAEMNESDRPRLATLILVPPNATVPASGPNGFIGDRVHQSPAVFGISALRREVFLWPDDVVTRTFFSLPGVEFVPGRTAGDALRALAGRNIKEAFCLYSPSQTISPQREADCQLLREADSIVANLPGITVFQPPRIDPLGNIPVWCQLWKTFHGQQNAPEMPWLRPTREAASWASKTLASEFPEWRESDPIVILSPFSGSPKKAVEDTWWRTYCTRHSSAHVIAPVYGRNEVEKARALFAGTSVCVVEADLDQTIALGALPNSEVIGVDGGRLNLLAASCKGKVSAFYGIWPASAWALPNVRML